MSAVVRTLFRDPRVRLGVLAVVSLLAVIGVLAFVVTASGATPEPVPFEETTTAGLTAEHQQELREAGLTVPKVEVFYSQYRFVVGYRGIEYAVTEFQQPGHEQQFGYPIAVWVSDYTGAGVELTTDGLLASERDPGWVRASSAQFVVDSEAHTPAGETVVPFASESDASAFAAEYGGEVVGWSTLQGRSFDIDQSAAVRDRVDEQHAAGDERAAAARTLLDRDQSVVGNDSTLQAAIDAAEPGSTVVVPEGTYRETVTVDKPLTLRGENATVRGDGNGTVVEIRSDDVAIVGLTITGVGESLEPDEGEIDDDGWDGSIDAAYGYADAGIEADNASGTYVADVSIETPAHGILLRDADAVVEGVTVEGTDEWTDGFMGVISLREPVVVQNSTFEGGRDGVYLHRAHDTVVRNNTFRENRFGVHLMYTSETLIADNVARRETSGGVMIMTNPARNAIVGNDIRNSSTGISTSGERNYVADNVVANNGRGMMTGSSQTLYERNVIYGNDLGIRTGSIRPTDRIVRNDFVANDEVIRVGGIGPLAIWTSEGVGNYWDGATVRPGQGSYSPTDPIESRYREVPGTVTLAASPAASMLDAVRDTTPGMREGNVLDTAPLSEPVRPETLAELEAETDD
ncbi:NosD domain-containing protein [Halovenus amylolytica]|uniref:NosD domain-containing protein n=1 Tax=Halovenus amylolytica TaxID=2500550 RepID=UPI00361FFEEA